MSPCGSDVGSHTFKQGFEIDICPLPYVSKIKHFVTTGRVAQYKSSYHDLKKYFLS